MLVHRGNQGYRVKPVPQELPDKPDQWDHKELKALLAQPVPLGQPAQQGLWEPPVQQVPLVQWGHLA
jgi:hypothetical protein